MSKRVTDRKWLYRLAAFVLVPVLFLLALEGGLRLFGYGYPTGFFAHLRVGGRDFVVNNPSFSLRFFPPQLTRWPPRVMMEAEKPANTIRIFILGESAAMGDPEVAFGAGRYLEVLLNEQFPGKHFEVVNVAITAINSNVILPIARDCARQDGDLWIVYMGNNEMVGPFGAATVFGAQAPPLAMIRLNLLIQRARVGQLLTALIRKLHRESSPASWGGMEMFLGNQLSPDDPRKEIVYKNFERNLDGILRAGVDSGAKILLSTVAVNLKDCPPFGSLDANAIHSAESEYHRAQTLYARGEAAGARAEFQKACDDDTLPFRADSRINGLIKKVGGQFPDKLTTLYDAAGDLAPDGSGICGDETFYEHVHFNFDGNYRLARAWAARVESLLSADLRAVTASNWASQETCERRLGLTDWNRYSAIGGVIQRMRLPPLSMQSNNAQRIQALRDDMERIHSRMTDAARIEAREIYLDALKRAPADHFLHENFAAFLAATGDLDGAIAQWRQVHELVPRDFTVYSRIGGLLAREGKWAEAETSFNQALALYPAFGPGWVGLGETRAAEGKNSEALEDFERARSLDPNEPRTRYYIGGVLSKLNRSADAVQSFREAVRLDPDYWEAHFALGVELGSHDDLAGARSEFEDVVRLNPAYADAHLNLAVALMQQNQWQDAQRQLEETLSLEPGNTTAMQYLRQVREKLPIGP